MNDLFSEEELQRLIAALLDGVTSGRMKWRVSNDNATRFTLSWGSFRYEVASVDGDGVVPFVLTIEGVGEYSPVPPQQVFSHTLPGGADPWGGTTGALNDTPYANRLTELYSMVQRKTLKIDSAVETALKELDQETDPNEAPF